MVHGRCTWLPLLLSTFLLLIVLVAVAICMGGSLRCRATEKKAGSKPIGPDSRVATPTKAAIAALNRTRQPSATAQTYANRTLFVSIASYRDTQCQRTLLDLYAQADYPERIFVGIYEQNKTGQLDEQCMPQLAQLAPWLVRNVRIHRVEQSRAAGPAAARYHCAQLYQGEHFFLQLDSHMRFLPGWDSELLSMWHECRTLYGIAKVMVDDVSCAMGISQVGDQVADRLVLSQYPLEFDVHTDQLPADHAKTTSAFCDAKFNGDDMVQPLAAIMPAGSYRRSPFIAGGMLFAPGRMLTDVPYDPDLAYLFHGEEMLYSVRLYCAGYRIFCPPRNVIFHYYERSHEPKIWKDDPEFFKRNKTALQKAKHLLGLGLGLAAGDTLSASVSAIRPDCLSAFYREFGIDVVNRTFARKWC